jgi:hypothetical protein
MKQKMIRAYFIYHDGCYSTIEEVMAHPDSIDNSHTCFHKLSDAKKCLIDDLKYTLDMYRDGINRIKTITNKTIIKRG